MTPDAALQAKLDAVTAGIVAQGKVQTEALIAAVVAAGASVTPSPLTSSLETCLRNG